MAKAKEFRFELSKPLENETTVRYGQQYFWVINSAPYVRKSDGADSFIMQWQTTCSLCDAEFRFTTGIRFPARDLISKCKACKPSSRHRNDPL